MSDIHDTSAAIARGQENRRSLVAQLSKLLADMDVPDQRRGEKTEASLEWLGRNLFVRNKNNKNFFDASVVLDALGIEVYGTRLKGRAK